MHRVEVPMTADDLLLFVLSQASSINAVSTGFASLEALELQLRSAMSAAVPRALAATVMFDVPLSLLRRE
jgi:hypothetical protein